MLIKFLRKSKIVWLAKILPYNISIGYLHWCYFMLLIISINPIFSGCSKIFFIQLIYFQYNRCIENLWWHFNYHQVYSSFVYLFFGIRFWKDFGIRILKIKNLYIWIGSISSLQLSLRLQNFFRFLNVFFWSSSSCLEVAFFLFLIF